MIRPYRGIFPRIPSSAFVEASAQIIGDVVLGERASVWFNTVVRGDVNYIRIGEETNVQDGSVVHVTRDKYPTIIGNRVSIGHNATVHGCVIEDHCLIGMGAVILDQVVVGEGSIVAAGAVVTSGMKIPPRSLVAGVPALIKKQLGEEDRGYIETFWRNYIDYVRIYTTEDHTTPRGSSAQP